MKNKDKESFIKHVYSDINKYYLSIKIDAITFCYYMVCSFVNQRTSCLPACDVIITDGADSVLHIPASLI